MKKICFIIIACTAAVSCSMSSSKQSKDLAAYFKKAISLYNSDRWTDRVSAVKMINSYLYNADNSQVITKKNRSSYDRISEDLLLEASTDRQAAVRIESAAGLGLSGTKNAYNRLREISGNDPDINVKWYALNALSLYKSNESASIFITSMKSDDWLIRESAVSGLLNITDAGVKKKYIREIVSALRDPNQTVRTAALERLDFIDDSFYPVIASMLKRKDMTVKYTRAVLKALNGYALDQDTRDIIIKDYLTHSDPDIRIYAYRVLTSDNKGIPGQ